MRKFELNKLKSKYCYIIIALFSFAIFYNTLSNDFVFDDESVVQNYTAIRNLSNIPKFFTAQEGFHKVIGRYYRPVVSTTYAIDYALWNLTPWGFHLTNIIINLITCLFLFAILSRLFINYKYGILASLIATLIFAAHPVHTEAVSWVSGRTDSLVTLFFFATFYFYLKFYEDNESKYLYISLVFYFFGLLTKEMIVTIPVIIVLFDFTWRKKSIKEILQDWKTYSLYAGLTIIYLYLRFLVLRNITERTTYNYFYGQDMITAIATMLKTIPVYLKLLVFPVNLLYHYNGVLPDSHSFMDAGVLFSIVIIIALIIASAAIYKNSGEITFGILFIFITLLPVMNIVPTMNYMAERFLYVTSFSVSLLAAYLFVKYINEKNKNLFSSSALIIIIVFSYLTLNRNAEWKNNDTLYSTAEGKDGSVLLVNCGNIYANKKQFEEAEKRFKRAIEIRYNNVLAHHNLGLIYLIRGSLDSAETEIKKGTQIDSLAPDGFFQLSNIYYRQNRIIEAIFCLEKLQSISPDYADSKKMLDMLKSGSTDTLQNIPGNLLNQNGVNNQVGMLENRSYQYYQQKKYKEAIKDIEDMIKLNPNGKSGYLNNLALCYSGLGEKEKAKNYFDDAIKIDGKNINALAGLAEYYTVKGEKNKAIEFYKRILAINPSDENALKKIDSLKAK